MKRAQRIRITDKGLICLLTHDAADELAGFAHNIWEGEVHRSGPHKGKVPDADARKDIARIRRLARDLRRLGARITTTTTTKRRTA